MLHEFVQLLRSDISGAQDYIACGNISKQQALEYMCKHGYLEIAKWLVEKYPCITNFQKAFEYACAKGHLDVAQWIITNHPICSDDAFWDAFADSNIVVLKWLVQQKDAVANYINEYILESACQDDNLEIFEWLLTDYAFDAHAHNESLFARACFFDAKKIVAWFEKNAKSNLRYFCHDSKPYIIGSDPIPEWQHTIIDHCPIAHICKIDEQAVALRMNRIFVHKTARKNFD